MTALIIVAALASAGLEPAWWVWALAGLHAAGDALQLVRRA